MSEALEKAQRGITEGWPEEEIAACAQVAIAETLLELVAQVSTLNLRLYDLLGELRHHR